MKRADLIRSAVEWIALNDEPTDLDPTSVAGYISTLLAADLLGVKPSALAASVVRQRRAERRRRAEEWVKQQKEISR